MRTVLVTGATGFVGRQLLPLLAARGWQVRAATRRPDALGGVVCVPVGDIGPDTDWGPALAGIDAVVHLAARVHRPAEIRAGLADGYERDNHHGTATLARAAVRARVRRLVYVSSVKALGEGTRPGQPFTDATPPAPVDVYGVSKLNAERAIQAIAADSGLAWVILRPPLVHGPGAVGNLAALAGAIRRGLPLPLGLIDNRRSLIHVANLCDALACALDHPAAPGTWLVSDGTPLATPQIVRALAEGVGRPARLLPVPPALIRLGARLLGRPGLADRLCGDLALDDSPFRTATGWTPPYTAIAGLVATGRGEKIDPPAVTPPPPPATRAP